MYKEVLAVEGRLLRVAAAVALLVHVRAELQQAQLVGGDGPALPGRRHWGDRTSRARGRDESLAEGLRKLGVDQLTVDTHSDYAVNLRRFFTMRERRFR